MVVATVEVSVSRAIQSARLARGLKQKQLATLISEREQVVNEYESGAAVPSQQVLAKLERVLKVKLRGSDVGRDLLGEPPGAKK